jgi:hypothetical protein
MSDELRKVHPSLTSDELDLIIHALTGRIAYFSTYRINNSETSAVYRLRARLERLKIRMEK